MPSEPVAVAVTVFPAPTFRAGEKVKETLPSELGLTFFWPMNLLPSSPPDGAISGTKVLEGSRSHDGLPGAN